MKNLLAILALVAGLLLPVNAWAVPNIVIIMLDDLGKEGLAPYYRRTYGTPNINRLAEEGATFSRFYTSATCSPTRATLLTGLYADRHGITSVNDVQTLKMCLDTALGSLAQAVKTAGYATAVSGKWHVCPFEELADPGKLGFDHPGAMGFDEWLTLQGGPWGGDITINRVEQTEDLNLYAADLQTDFALDFMRNTTEPFFLYFPTRLVHSPWDRVPGSTKTWPFKDTRWFPLMVEYVDGLIGQLLDELDTLGIANNTVVFFLTDNGTNKNTLNVGGGKATSYENGINNPFIVRWPGHIQAGAIVTGLADLTDIYPTVVELSGATPPARTFADDGFSLVSRLTTGAPLARSWAYSRSGKKWALVRTRMKLTEEGLFNLKNDPLEDNVLTTQSNINAMNAILDAEGLFHD